VFASTFIDTAIGVSFVFLLLSVAASTVNEIILSFLNMRAQELLRGLKMLLNDEDASGLVKKIYNHGLIYGLFKGEFDPKSRDLPAYIPSTNFAAALLDVIRDEGGQATDVPQDAAAVMASLRRGAEKLLQNETTAKVGKPLIAMINAAQNDVTVAQNDITKVRNSVEAWFNSAMDRVSGWYKYKTQWMLFWIGLVLAVALNAGTIRIVRVISTSPTLRESIVAAAQSAKAPTNPSGASANASGASSTQSATPPSTDQSAQQTASQSGASSSFEDKVQDVSKGLSQLEGIGVPLGWTGTCPNGGTTCWSPSWWAETAAGWLLTAIGVSLGAPFWFDLLNKFMVVRSTVKPKEKSGDEASKD
jgi:hypothetical protein